jgi:hypothetical protein
MVVEIVEKTEAAEAIRDLLLLIEDTNEMIRRNTAHGIPHNDVQISGYERIRQELIEDLIEMLNEFNIPVKFQAETAMQTALAA